MAGKQLDLGLSLSLGNNPSHNHKHSTSLHRSSSSSSLYFSTQCTNKLIRRSGEPAGRRSSEEHQAGSGVLADAPSLFFLRAIDVNRKPAATFDQGPAADLQEGEQEELYEGEESLSPASTLTSSSGKRNERDPAVFSGAGDANHLLLDRTASSRGISDDGELDGETNSRKKLRLSKEQSALLEECFKTRSTLNTKQKMALANQLSLRPRQVEVWFQNRRARTKLKQTEVDCKHLKGCCDKISEENGRLEKEIAELRALQSLLRPQKFQLERLLSPTTLTMCPSCCQRSVVMLPSRSS